MSDYNKEEDYEPTQDEWDEIEELILQEEMDEIREERREMATDLVMFKSWCKENGIIW